ncbi:MAG: hypothetical protein ABIN25_04040 [Ginsengibacter sp.]
MLGIALLYFIGKYYYKLAEYNNKSPWGYAIIGVATYYGGTFLAGILLGLVLEISSIGSVEDMSTLTLGIIALPFGVGATALLYHLLKKNWEKQRKTDMEMIEQIGT